MIRRRLGLRRLLRAPHLEQRREGICIGIGHLLDQMLDHQDGDGRFQSYAAQRSNEPAVWGRACRTR